MVRCRVLTAQRSAVPVKLHLGAVASVIVSRCGDGKQKNEKKTVDHVWYGGTRKINKTVARSMMALRHYAFRQHLLHVAKNYGTVVHVTTEEYTSKTCGQCGRLNERLGSSKTFVCPQEGCGFVGDRDANAARNILIRFFTTQPAGRRPSPPDLVAEEAF